MLADAVKRREKIESYKKIVLESRRNDNDRVLEYCHKIIELADETSDEDALGFAYFYIGEVEYLTNSLDEMFGSMLNALRYLGNSGQWCLAARVYNVMGITSVSRGNTVAAMEYYMSGLYICEEHDVKSVHSSIELNLGYLYLDAGVYKEAEEYFLKAYNEYVRTPAEKRRNESLTMIYTNLATCHLLAGELDKAREYIGKLKDECQASFSNMDYIYVECLEVRFHHICGDYESRDKIIDDVKRRLSRNVLIMDIFDDIYDFCNLMIEIDRLDVLQEIIERLDEPIKKTQINNLKRKFLTLKIKLYMKNGDKEACDGALVSFFDLSEKLEEDKQKMIASILHVRNSVDKMKDKQRVLEAEKLKLLERSETDQLTGIANRYRLVQYAQSSLAKCKRERIPLSYEVLDIDYFKQYNDTYGHQAGDECIKAVAGILADIQNDSIFAARYGGDEFVVIYVGMSVEEVVRTAEVLKRRVQELGSVYKGAGVDVGVTISQGICHCIPEEDSKDRDYLYSADIMLYNVKRKKRNGICVGDLSGKEIDY